MQKHTLTTLISGALLTFASLNVVAQDYNATGSTSKNSNAQKSQSKIPEGLGSIDESFWTRDTMTGDWGGLRSQLAEKGVTVSATYQAETFGNVSGGIGQGAVAGGLFNLALDIDLERLTGFLKDTNFHANVMYLHGTSISEKYTGDFSGVSNIAGYNTIRLQEIWLEKQFWDKRASIRAGMLAADTEFFLSDSAALFLNGTFGAFSIFGANFPDAPAYPVANPGVRINIQPTSNFYVKAAVFGMDTNSDQMDDPHGVDLRIKSSDGALFITELGYLYNQSPGDRGLTGTYKVGSFLQHGDFYTWQSQAFNALSGAPLSSKGTNYAVYFVADQQLYVSGGKIVSGFVRGGFSPSQYSFVSGYAEGGFNFTGFVPGRDQDIIGVAVADSEISGEYSKGQVLQGNPSSSREVVIEATYKTNLTPWWTVQPDMQYIINPSGVEGSRNAFVLGVRTGFTF